MRVVLLCHAETEGVRLARFGGDDAPTASGLAGARSLVPPRVERVSCAPSIACRSTADAMGVHAQVDHRLRGCDYGRWAGRTLEQVLATEPDAVGEWLADPAAAPHGGESLAGLRARAGRWLDDQPTTAHTVLAVADAAVIRAVVAHGIDGGPRSVWRIDVSPLTRAVLAGGPGRWSLRELGR